MPQCGTRHLNTVEWCSSRFTMPATGTMEPASPMAGSSDTSSAQISSFSAAASSSTGREFTTEPTAAVHASNSMASIERMSYMASCTEGIPAANSAAHMVSVSQIIECWMALIILGN